MSLIPLGQIIGPAKVMRSTDPTLPVLSVTRHNGLVEQDSVFNKQIAGRDKSKYLVVSPHQLVVGIHIDEGALAVSNDRQRGIVSPAYKVWDIKEPESICSSYLNKIIRSPQAVGYFASHYRQTAHRRGKIRKEDFLGLQIPLPPLPVQKRIAAILDAADALRAKRRESIEQLDSLIQSTFLEMFGDPDTRQTVGSMLESGVLELHKDGNHGSLYPRSSEFGREGIPFLSAKCVSDSGELLRTEVQFLNERKARALRLGWLKSGDVLLAHNASVGKTYHYRGEFPEALIGTSLTAFRPSPDRLNSSFLFGALRADDFQNQLHAVMGQTTRNQVPISAQRRLFLPLPALDLQTRFASIVESIEQQKTRLKAHLAELDTLFASLQSRAFNGELVA